MLIGFKARNHPQQKASDSVDDRATTVELFAPLNDRFGFTVDAAASDANTKLPKYWTKADDGLAQDWSTERVWCNPPYSSIEPWVVKALSSPSLTVLLLPANRTEQGWWQDHVEPVRDKPGSRVRTEFLRGRHRFLSPGEATVRPNSRPPFGLVLVIVEAGEPYTLTPTLL